MTWTETTGTERRIESNGLNCDVCFEPTAAMHPQGDAPHALGCIEGDGFDGMTPDEAREWALGAAVYHDAWPNATRDLAQYNLRRLRGDVIAGGDAHGYDNQLALVLDTGTDTWWMASMVTGTPINIHRDAVNPVHDELGVPLHIGDDVYLFGRTAAITAIDDSDPLGAIIIADLGLGQRYAAAGVRRVLELWWAVETRAVYRAPITMFELMRETGMTAAEIAAAGPDDLNFPTVDGLLIEQEQQRDNVDVSTLSRQIINPDEPNA